MSPRQLLFAACAGWLARPEEGSIMAASVEMHWDAYSNVFQSKYARRWAW